MRITEQHLRQIIREELLREEEATQATTDYANDTAELKGLRERDPLLTALKKIVATGRRGSVYASGGNAPDEQELMATTRGIFRDASSQNYQSFLNLIIKPERRDEYEEKFNDLRSARARSATDNYITIPVADTQPGRALGDTVMGIFGVDGKTNTILTVRDFKDYSVDETYDFLKKIMEPTYAIKVYDTTGDGFALIYDAAPGGKSNADEPGAANIKASAPPEKSATKASLSAAEQPVVPEGWVTRVSKAPLQRGSAGDDVKAAQELVGIALISLVNEATEEKIGKTLVASLRKLAAANKIKITDPEDSDAESVDNLVVALGGEVSAEPDGKFGEMTQLAVKIFQAISGLTPDGRIGKDTATKLTAGARGAISEHVINRWNKLAGLLVD